MKFSIPETHKAISFFKAGTVFKRHEAETYPSLRGRGLKTMKVYAYISDKGNYPDTPEIFTIDASEFPALKNEGFYMLENEGVFTLVNPA